MVAIQYHTIYMLFRLEYRPRMIYGALYSPYRCKEISNDQPGNWFHIKLHARTAEIGKVQTYHQSYDLLLRGPPFQFRSASRRYDFDEMFFHFTDRVLATQPGPPPVSPARYYCIRVANSPRGFTNVREDKQNRFFLFLELDLYI
jgi:hypothetical protein